jgi:transcriptional regulator with XRE-family HTH domain
LSKQELATRAGLHQTYVGLLEGGKRKPNLETAEAVAKALQLNLSELIREAEMTRPKA